MTRYHWSVCTVLLLAATAVRAGIVVPVTACGQVIDGNAQLVSDLDCSASSPALTIHRGSLDLNGFTITGDQITCDDSCTVGGPGNLDLAVYASENLVARNLTSSGSLSGTAVKVEGCTISGGIVDAYTAATVIDSELLGSGVYVYLPERGRARIENTTIQDAPSIGVDAKTATIIGSTIIRSGGAGIVSRQVINSNNRKIGKASIIDSTIAENGGAGVVAGNAISVRNSTIRDNLGTGLHCYEAYRSDSPPGVPIGGVKLLQSTVSGNGDGVLALKAFVSDSAVTANNLSGIKASSLTVRGLSDLRGNGVSSPCGTDVLCFDVVTTNKPFGANVANCDTSWKAGFFPDNAPPVDGSSWGVCALD